VASITSTIDMIDEVNKQLQKVVRLMNQMVSAAERLSRSLQSIGSSGSSAKSVPDKIQLSSNVKQVVQVTNQIINNYSIINQKVSQNNVLLNKTTNNLSQTNVAILNAAKNQANYTSEVKKSKKAASALWEEIKKMSIKQIIDFAKASVRVSDEFINTKLRLNMVNDGLQTTEQLQDKIFAAAARSRGVYTKMADAVSDMAMAAGHNFSNNDEIIAFAELLQKTFAISGLKESDQQAVMTQMTQIMANGKMSGSDFTSVIGKVPMLAQSIAQYLGVGTDKLAEMSAQGKITSDVIKAAMFSAANDINNRFNQLPRTFGGLWNEIVNNTMWRFAPVFEKISAVLNNPVIGQGIGALGTVLSIAANAASHLLDAVGAVFSFISSNWSIIAPIIWGIVAAIAAYRIIALLSAAATWVKTFADNAHKNGLIAAAAAQWGLNAALLASPITWIILALIAIVAIIYAVVGAINKFAGTTISATGIIAGAFAFVGAVIWDIIVGVINSIILFIWRHFVEPFVGMFEWLLNVFNGGFDSFGDAVKNLFGKIISWFLSLGKIATKVIDAIFGTNWTQELEDLQNKLEDWGKNNQAIDLNVNGPPTLPFLDPFDAWDAGYNWGKDLESKLDSMTNGLDDLKDQLDFGDQINSIRKVEEVEKIRDTVDVSSEDLKLMRELAEMSAIQNFVTLQPQLSFGDTHIRQDGRSIEEIVANITQRLQEEIASSAKGLFA